MKNNILKVFITIDTEVWDDYENIAQNIDTAIYGNTQNRLLGLQFIVDLLNSYGLKGCFFVEPLFSCLSGVKPLANTIEIIQHAGHEVQLHLHTEWLRRMSKPVVKFSGINMKNYSMPNQSILINYGMELLSRYGAKNVCAFRAGNFGANFDTLQALAQNKILYDTSYNACYLNRACGMKMRNLLFQPKKIGSIWEFPISFFCDMPSHFRHMQITACSFQEIRSALLQAFNRNWFSVVIVMHTFEFLHRHAHTNKSPELNSIVLKRFDNLCRFLSDNRDKFCTTMFSQIDKTKIPQISQTEPLKSNVIFTGIRYIEQAFTHVIH